MMKVRKRRRVDWAAVCLWLVATMTASAQSVLFVDAFAPGGGDGLTWFTAYDDLQEALAYAATQPAVDEIWLASGVYAPGTDADDAFALVNGVEIYGGFAGWEFVRSQRVVAMNPTVLTGATAFGRVRHVIDGSGATATTLVDGVIVEGGLADGPTGDDRRGGGLFVRDGSPRFTGCVFRMNDATDRGGAAYIDGGSAVRFTDCVFELNNADAGGALLLNATGVTRLTNCVLASNVASGPTGRGGAIRCDGAGGVALTNVIMTGNIATDGGGMFVTGPLARIVNATIAGNIATGVGGGIRSAGGDVTLRNTILWDNADATGRTESAQVTSGGTGAALSVIYCCIDGLTTLTGAGNFDADPLFVDPTGADGTPGTSDDDLRLMIPSPCIDAGSNESVPTDIVDLDDDGDTSERTPLDIARGPRFEDEPGTPDTGVIAAPIVDIGAHEFTPFQRLLVTPTNVSVPEGGDAAVAVRLNLPPTSPVTVEATFNGGDADLSVTAGSMLFFDASNYDEAQQVTISAAEDADFAAGVATFRLSSSLTDDVIVTATESDDEVLPPGVIVVDDDAASGGDGAAWSVAFDSLQDALAAANASGGVVTEVWVASGDYRPSMSGDESATFALIEGVRVLGGFAGSETSVVLRDPAANETVLNGDLGGGARSTHVVTASNVSSATVLDGFTIRNGRADGVGADEDRGAGLLCRNGSPVIRRCRFEMNASPGGSGGGVWTNSGLRLVECAFVGNEAGSGGGFADGAAAAASVIGCRFHGNSAAEGGAVHLTGSSLLVNVIMTGNVAATGGGIASASASPRTPSAVNVTIASNAAALSGGGVASIGTATFVLENCIIWGNEDAAGRDESAQVETTFGPISIARCCVEGLTGDLGGPGNTGAPPRFAGSVTGQESDDVRLAPGSPCIDAGRSGPIPPDVDDLDGDGNVVEALPTDARGSERFVDDPLVADVGAGSPPWLDLGAIEFTPGELGVEWIATTTGGWFDGGNWRPTTPDGLTPAIFWRDATYAVNTPSSTDVDALALTDGDIELNLGGATLGVLNATEPVRVEGASVTIRSGEVLATSLSIRDGGSLEARGTGGRLTLIEDAVVEDGVIASNNNGVVESGGAVRISRRGLLIGDSTFDADVLVGGALSPGGPDTAVLAVTGDLSLTLGAVPGRLSSQVNGFAPGGSYDVVSVGGTATLGGVLDARAASDFEPATGSSFDLVTATQVTGSFDVAYVTTLPAGRAFTIDLTDPTRVRLTVAAASIPLGLQPPEPFDLLATPSDATLSDVDGDGDPDYVFIYPAASLTNPGRVVFQENRGLDAGVWQGFIGRGPSLVGVDPTSLSLGDFDDGAGLDVAVTNRGSDSVTIGVWNGSDGFTTSTTLTGSFASPVAAASVSLNGDGRSDLAVLASSAPLPGQFDPGGAARVVTYVNASSGSPSFTETDVLALGGEAVWMTAAELTGDGLPDLIAATRSPHRVTVLTGQVGGGFAIGSSVDLDEPPIRVRAAALDASGVLHVVALTEGSVSVLLNDGSGVLSGPHARPLASGAFDVWPADMDGDGDAELLFPTATASESEPSLGWWRSDALASGVLLATDRFVDTLAPARLARVADVDGDGQVDVVIANDQSTLSGLASPLTVLRSEPAPSCAVDVTGDGLVNFDDLNMVLTNWRAVTPRYGMGDADGSGRVDFEDLNMLLGAWNTGCTP